MKITKETLRQIIKEELLNLKETYDNDEPDDRTHGEYFADVNNLPREPLAPSIDDAISGYGDVDVLSAVGEYLESLREKIKDDDELAQALNQFIEDKFSDMQRFNKQFALGEEKKIPSLKQIIKEELENLMLR